MRHETFDAAQRLRQRKQFERFGEAFGAVGTALHFECDDGTKPGLLSFRDVVARMRREAREVDTLDRFLLGEKFRHRLRVLSVLAKPHTQCAQAAQREVAVERRARQSEAVGPPA